MARKALGPATLRVVQAVDAAVTGPMLVACSGGPDSLALAAAAVHVGRRRGLAVRAVVIDHGLQQNSAGIAAAAAGQLESLGLATTVLAVEVVDAGGGVESAARVARYAALEKVAGEGEVVLLGHTMDDQAETVLLGLARGSGTRSLAGMPPVRGRLVRPLLGLRTQTTRDACAELGLRPWSDPHNADPSFTRARVRHRVLPVLEAELGPGVVEALARSADLARADADLLDSLAAAELAEHPAPELDCARLAGLAPALRGRVLRDWLRGQGARDLSAITVAGVAAVVTDWHGQRPVDVPGLRVERTAGRLRVRPR